MTVYLDTSALVKLYIDEPGSAEVVDLIGRADLVATSTLAYPEMRAALARRRRERTLTPKELTRVRQQFDDDWALFLVLSCDGQLARRAGALAELHALRGGDAVHLASFERLLSSTTGEPVHFLGADDRLNRAAAKLG